MKVLAKKICLSLLRDKYKIDNNKVTTVKYEKYQNQTKADKIQRKHQHFHLL